MANSDQIAIKVDDLGKSFKLPHEKRTSVKSTLINFYKNPLTYEIQNALKNVSFEVKKGEFFGIVGRNGSGKSTLLKLLAGIYTPTSGQIQVEGKLTPFIELGVGFNPELTGRENVFLNGALLGFDRHEMRGMYKDIVEFAELQKFMDQKLKNYSSGMQVRLAFSIAIRANSDILLIDEVLAVGDLDFQKKCYNYFLELKNRGKTIIFVTHDMSAIRRFCDKCILINDSIVLAEGSAEDISDMYENINLRHAEKRLTKDNKSVIKKKRQGNNKAIIEKVETFNAESRILQATFSSTEKIAVRIEFKCLVDIPAPTVGFILQNQDDLTVFATNNKILEITTAALKKGDHLVAETIIDPVFTDGEYTITCAIESDNLSTIYDRVEYIHRFMVGGHKLPHALAHPNHHMKLIYSRGH